MITEISLHGTANEKIDYHVSVTCADFSNRYFPESLPEGDRFFSGPNEFVISRSGVRYNGTGGSLCEYMFGVDLPLKDLLRKDVSNRLVMFGAFFGTDETISFTNTTAGEAGGERGDSADPRVPERRALAVASPPFGGPPARRPLPRISRSPAARRMSEPARKPAPVTPSAPDKQAVPRTPGTTAPGEPATTYEFKPLRQVAVLLPRTGELAGPAAALRDGSLAAYYSGSPAGRRQVAVTARPLPDGGARIVVADNGPGVAADMVDSIFDRFWTTKSQGMGMGLAISSDLFRGNDRNYGVTLYAYTLMANHVHLLLQAPLTERLARPLRWFFRETARAWQRTRGRRGHFWERRYWSCLVDDDEYALAALRYCDRNPIRAGLVEDPASYPWSSCAAYALGVPNPLVQFQPSYLALSPYPKVRQPHYRSLLEPSGDPRADARDPRWTTERVVGGEAFMAQHGLRRRTGRKSRDPDQANQ